MMRSARFSAAGTRLVIEFDSQRTNRAGFTGQAPCSLVLSASTIALVQGSSTASPACFWSSDTVLQANFDYLTKLRPGDTVSLIKGAIGPYTLAGSQCPGAALCAGGNATISVEAPCGEVSCPTPVAVLSGPLTISDCAGAGVILSATDSYGGGIVSLSYTWGVDAETTDNAAAIGTALGLLASTTSSTTIGASLLVTGTSFTFTLVARSFLGGVSAVTSFTVTRTSFASPTLTLVGAASRIARPDASHVVRASAVAANCWLSSGSITYTWTLQSVKVTSTSVAVSGVTLALPAAEVGRSAVTLAANTLVARRSYTLLISAHMTAQPAAIASTTVMLVVPAQELRAIIAGGDRTHSAARALTIDGSASTNPNDDSGLSYLWSARIRSNASDTLAAARELDVAAELLGGDAAAATTSMLVLGSEALDAGEYVFTLTVSDTFSLSSSATIAVTALGVTVPSISFAPLNSAKYNAQWALPTRRLSLSTSLDTTSASLTSSRAWIYKWRAYTLVNGVRSTSEALALANTVTVTRTGASLSNLAFRSGALTAGATYAFELTVSPSDTFNFESTALGSNVGSAIAEVTVTINAPPYGGGLTVSPESGEALTDFELTAPGWSDDDSDLPLTYSFGYSLGSTIQVLGSNSLADSLSVVFPAGELAISLVVSDAYGAWSTKSGAVSVSTPTLSADDFLLSVERAKDSVEGGTPEVAQRLLVALARLVEDAFGSSRRRLLGETNATNADAFNSTVAQWMLDIARSASSIAEESAEGRAQAISTLTALLNAAPDVLEGSARADGLEQLQSVLEASEYEGVDKDSTANAMSAVDAVLLADSSALSTVDLLAIGLAVAGSASGLGRSLLAGALAGEEVSTATGSTLNLTASRAYADAVQNVTLSPAFGVGGVSLPSGTLDAQEASLIANGVNVLMYVVDNNLYQDPSAQALGALGTYLFAVELGATDGSGAKLNISSLASPVTLAVPLDSTAANSQLLQCHYWHSNASIWSTDGCTTLKGTDAGHTAALDAAGMSDGESVVVCSCDHLTTFAGFSVPDSAEEAAEEADLSINTISASDVKGAITEPMVEGTHEYMLYVVSSITGANFLCVLLAVWADRRYARKTRKRAIDLARTRAALAQDRARRITDEVERLREQRRRVEDAKISAAAGTFVERNFGTLERSAARTIQSMSRGRSSRKATWRATAKGPAERQPSVRRTWVRGRTRDAAALAVDDKPSDSDSWMRGRTREVAVAAVDDASPLASKPKRAALRKRSRCAEWFRHCIRSLEENHSLFACLLSRSAELHRAELVQVAFNMLMLEVVIECLLFDTSSGTNAGGLVALDNAESEPVALIPLLITALLTSALAVPGFLIMRLIWMLSEPASVSKEARLLGGLSRVVYGKYGVQEAVDSAPAAAPAHKRPSHWRNFGLGQNKDKDGDRFTDLQSVRVDVPFSPPPSKPELDRNGHATPPPSPPRPAPPPRRVNLSLDVLGGGARRSERVCAPIIPLLASPPPSPPRPAAPPPSGAATPGRARVHAATQDWETRSSNRPEEWREAAASAIIGHSSRGGSPRTAPAVKLKRPSSAAKARTPVRVKTRLTRSSSAGPIRPRPAGRSAGAQAPSLTPERPGGTADVQQVSTDAASADHVRPLQPTRNGPSERSTSAFERWPDAPPISAAEIEFKIARARARTPARHRAPPAPPASATFAPGGENGDSDSSDGVSQGILMYASDVRAQQQIAEPPRAPIFDLFAVATAEAAAKGQPLARRARLVHARAPPPPPSAEAVATAKATLVAFEAANAAAAAAAERGFAHNYAQDGGSSSDEEDIPFHARAHFTLVSSRQPKPKEPHPGEPPGVGAPAGVDSLVAATAEQIASALEREQARRDLREERAHRDTRESKVLRALSMRGKEMAVVLLQRTWRANGAKLLVQTGGHANDAAALRRLLVLFAVYDVDKSGSIESQEFGALLAEVGEEYELKPHQERRLLRQIDAGGDGRLSRDELKAWFIAKLANERVKEAHKGSGKWRAPSWACKAFAWVLMLTIFLVLALIVIVYGRLFGEQLSLNLVRSWGIAVGTTFTLQEPLTIVTVATLPYFLETIMGVDACAEIVNAVVGSVLGKGVAGCMSCFHT
ncbi:REJ domain-containing protein [Pavlovales sp. CCMP2436]|nr:REJ domain-containing protein [Pavlovales sp. CCMP2436]